MSNGNGTPEVLEYIKPWVDLYKVDLKSFQDRNYRKLGGVLNNVLDTIQRLYAMGFWLEIVTLIIPGFNDSDRRTSGHGPISAGISPDIPWHVTAFHQDYKMTDPDNTPARNSAARGGNRKNRGLELCLCREPSGQGEQLGEYVLSRLRRTADRAAWLQRATCESRTALVPKCSRAIPGVWN